MQPGDNAKGYPAEVKHVLERAAAGDVDALPLASEIFDHYPELVGMLGDLARHAEDALLALAAGNCQPAKEAARRHLNDLRERLCASANSELERQLAARVSLDWLALHVAEMELA